MQRLEDLEIGFGYLGIISWSIACYVFIGVEGAVRYVILNLLKCSSSISPRL